MKINHTKWHKKYHTPHISVIDNTDYVQISLIILNHHWWVIVEKKRK